MSVKCEFNLLKQPSNNRVTTKGDGQVVVYFRETSLFTLEPETGTAASQIDLDVPGAKSIIAIACHPELRLSKEKNQLIAIGFDSGAIVLYDYALNSISSVHNEHKTKGQSLTWMGLHMTEQGIILSVVENSIYQYCSIAKKTKPFNSVLPKKFNATEISSTAFDPNLLAIGSYCGLLVVLSIKDMTIKYSYRGHNYQITSMVWMRNLNVDDDDCFDIYTEDFKEEFGTDHTRHLESDAYQGTRESPPANNQFDFVEACKMLKEDMLRSKEEKGPAKPNQLDRDECPQELNDSDASLSSGFSVESNASSNIEQLFEKIDIVEVEDLILVTLDQHMNVWVWDVRANRAKGNFKITSRANKQKKPVYHTAQFFLLDDQYTIVGNTCNAGFFTLLLSFDKQKNRLDFDYQVTENNSMVLGATRNRHFLAFYPYHAIKLMKYDKPSCRIVKEFPVYNSIGRSIGVSSVNPMRIAIGTHEICFFDLTTVSDTGCSFNTYYKNIKSGIVCLAWHPENESLAFGTLEGRIGIYNSVNQSVEFLKPFSGHEIYDLTFGRIDGQMCLFATSNGVCVYYFNEYKDFKAILGAIKDVSALYVDPVKNWMFIGTKQGNIYHKEVEKIEELNATVEPIKISRNYIRMFRVNCDHSKVVVASKSSDLVVISMNDIFSQSTNPSIMQLKGHTQPLVWVDFSAANPNRLLSTSYDQTIRVWDTSNLPMEGGELSSVGCYSFNAKLKYAIFSPLNEDCLIVGTRSTPFYVFNMNEKATDFPPKLVTIVKQNVQEKAGATASAQNTIPSAKTESKVVDLKKTETTVFYLAKRESSKKVLPCLQAIVKAELNGDAEEEDGFLNKKLFSNDLDQIKSFLLEEAKNYEASNIKSRGTELIALMGGNVKETIMEHVRDKSLTDEMIGLAPMVSYQFWMLCCEAYSVQLIEEQQPLKAVLYLLGLKKIDDAIKILMDKNYFREAWVLAKMKKSQDDPIFSVISTKWISNLDICGDYESAAVVAAGIHDYQTALDMLLKRREEQLSEDHHRVIDLLKLKLTN